MAAAMLLISRRAGVLANNRGERGNSLLESAWYSCCFIRLRSFSFVRETGGTNEKPKQPF